MVQKRSLLVLGTVFVCLYIVSGSAFAEDPYFKARKSSERYRIVQPKAERQILGEWNGVVMVSAPPEELRLARDRFHAGEGGGGDATSLEIYQAWFLDSACSFPTECVGPCNAALVTWVENTANPDGVTVLLNGEELGMVEGLDSGNLPGVNGAVVTALSPGSTTFGVRDSGDNLEEATITILDSQPFHDPENLNCTSGNATEGGGCDLLLSWENPGPWPRTNLLTLDSGPTVEAPGFGRGSILGGLAPGNHTVDVRGLGAENDQAFYLGCIVSTSCDLACTDAPCKPPVVLNLCQVAYGPGDTDNGVSASWVNGEDTYASGVVGFVDGGQVGTLEGNSASAFFSLLSPGEVTLGVQGDCGDPDGLSERTEAVFNVLTETPHVDPVVGDIACEFHPGEEPFTLLTWANGSPSLYTEAYLVVDPDRFYLGTIAGNSTSVVIGNTDGTETVLLQFFKRVDGMCYGSELLGCTPPAPDALYVQGVCNGAPDATGNPQITSAIFGLTFLFLGGEAPPCEKACDANGDGNFDLSDMVYVLSYLFLGGEAPTLWLDRDSDERPDPTCIQAAPEDDCAAGHPYCAG